MWIVSGLPTVCPECISPGELLPAPETIISVSTRAPVDQSSVEAGTAEQLLKPWVAAQGILTRVYCETGGYIRTLLISLLQTGQPFVIVIQAAISNIAILFRVQARAAIDSL